MFDGNGDFRDAILAALRLLPQKSREVLILHGIEGLPMQETAERLGLATKAAAGLYARALKHLRKLLGDGL